jgi:hypothetical protein
MLGELLVGIEICGVRDHPPATVTCMEVPNVVGAIVDALGREFLCVRHGHVGAALCLEVLDD